MTLNRTNSVYDTFRDEFLETFTNAQTRVLLDEPMSQHSTFKVGGRADLFISLASVEELMKTRELAITHGLAITVLGNGSNILVSDEGIRGVVACVSSDMAGAKLVSDCQIEVLAGTLLSVLSKFAAQNQLTGLEFAAGIPGTVGGAVYMNAGAYDGNIADLVVRSEAYDIETGEIYTVDCTADHCFDYRKSCFSNRNAVILRTWMNLRPGISEEIYAKMSELAGKRKQSQPLELPSAGSTFKRPQGHYTGKLVEECNLKGYRIGGASVSTKHAGFIVNDKNATAKDIFDLIKHVQAVVLLNTGVALETEVRILGEFGN